MQKLLIHSIADLSLEIVHVEGLLQVTYMHE